MNNKIPNADNARLVLHSPFDIKVHNKSGVHKDGMGWNANGVWCGECCKDTCEGCENEHKFFEGFSQETIDRLKKEIMEDDNEHL